MFSEVSPDQDNRAIGEVVRLREYLRRGGLIWADDFWGSAGWSHFSTEIQRVLPEYPLVELNPEHPLFNQLYVIPEVPQDARRSSPEPVPAGLVGAGRRAEARGDRSGELVEL